MARIRVVTQMELEGFADTVQDAEDAEGHLPWEETQRRLFEAKTIFSQTEPPAYMAQLQRLLTANVPWRIAVYVAWASVPKYERIPATQEALAREVLGLTSDRRIADWRKRYPIDQMIADLQGEMLMQYRPGVFDAIGWGASQRDYKAAAQQRLFVELTRDMPNPKIHVEDNRAVQDLGDLSDAELDALDGQIAKEMLKKIRDEESPLPSPPIAAAELGGELEDDWDEDEQRHR